MKTKTGYTLIELLIVVALIAIISTVGFLVLLRYRSNTDVDDVTRAAAAFLREAQSRSIAEASSSVWSVQFGNVTSSAPYYAIFAGTYSTGTIVSYSSFPADVSYNPTTLAVGSTTDISFSSITGTPSASTTIGFELLNGAAVSATTSVSINSVGSISYITK